MLGRRLGARYGLPMAGRGRAGRGKAIEIQLRLLTSGILVAGTLLVLLARRMLWQPGLLALAVAAMPFFVLLALLAVLLAAWGRHWKMTVAAVITLVFALGTQLPLFVADGDSASAASLRVATLNTQFGAADPGEIIALVREQNVDVLALQELPLEAADRLSRAGLDAVLPYRYVFSAPGYPGSALWTRWRAQDTRQLGGYVSPNVVSVLNVPQVGLVTVTSLHPAQPDLFEHAAWQEEHSRLRTELSTLAGPIVLAGDLNATVDQMPMRSLYRAGFRDAADQAGAGLLFTWPRREWMTPVFGFDHVLTRGGLRARSAEGFAINGSDHRAVVAQLSR